MSKPPFPSPHCVIGGQRRWTVRQIREFVAALAGEPPPEPQDDDEFLIGSAEVKKRLGISGMYIWRHTERQQERA